MSTIYLHYNIGINFGGTEAFILHRQPDTTDDNPIHAYSFEKKEILSGVAAKQAVCFKEKATAQEMIEQLQNPDNRSKIKLSKEVEENLELLEPIDSVVLTNDTRMLDHPGRLKPWRI